MVPHLKALAAPGWTTFDYTLMQSSEGFAVLVSDEIVRDYMSYMTTCRRAKQHAMDFSSWLTTSSVTALEPVASAR